MSGFFRFLFYFLVANVYLVSLLKDHSTALKNSFAKLGLDYHTSYGGRLKYLTYINLNLQTIYYIFCVVYSFYKFVLNNNKQNKNIKSFIDTYYCSIIWPLGCIVTTSFWGVFYIDRDLIYPEIIETVIPWWQNHVNHTLPLFSGFVESYFTKHSYSKRFSTGLLITWIVSLGYIAWIHIIAYFGGFWVYEVLAVLGPLNRFLFIAGLLVFASILYKLGEVINKRIWQDAIISKDD